MILLLLNIQMLYCCKVSCFGEVTHDCSMQCCGSLVVGVAVFKLSHMKFILSFRSKRAAPTSLQVPLACSWGLVYICELQFLSGNAMHSYLAKRRVFRRLADFSFVSFVNYCPVISMHIK